MNTASHPSIAPTVTRKTYAGERSTARPDTNVLIADDHGMMRAGLNSIVSSAPGLVT